MARKSQRSKPAKVKQGGEFLKIGGSKRGEIKAPSMAQRKKRGGKSTQGDQPKEGDQGNMRRAGGKQEIFQKRVQEGNHREGPKKKDKTGLGKKVTDTPWRVRGQRKGMSKKGTRGPVQMKNEKGRKCSDAGALDRDQPSFKKTNLKGDEKILKRGKKSDKESQMAMLGETDGWGKKKKETEGTGQRKDRGQMGQTGGEEGQGGWERRRTTH